MTFRRAIPLTLAIAGAALIAAAYTRGHDPNTLGAVGLVLLVLGLGFMPGQRTKP